MDKNREIKYSDKYSDRNKEDKDNYSRHRSKNDRDHDKYNHDYKKQRSSH